METFLPPPDPPVVPSLPQPPAGAYAVDTSPKGAKPEDTAAVRELVLAPKPKAAGGTLFDSWDTSHQDGTDYQVDTLNVAVGQAFTGVAGLLASVKFFLQKAGAPIGNAVAKLYAAAGSFPNVLGTGAALATSDPLDMTTIPAAGALTELLFSGANRYTMVAGTTYVIALEAPTADNTNKVRLGTHYNGGAPPQHYGNTVLRAQNAAWSNDPEEDLIFYLYKV